MNCTFANSSSARGCIFTFRVEVDGRNEVEIFYLTRNDNSTNVAEQCNKTLNQINVYNIQVVDWESDGSEGGLHIPVVPNDEPLNDLLCLQEERKC